MQFTPFFQVLLIFADAVHNSILPPVMLVFLFDRYQGGFIWDFIDQAILVKDEITGQEVLRYGGDR